MARSGGGDVGGALRARGPVRVSPARDRGRPESGDAAQDRGVRQLPLRRDARDQPQSRRDRSRPHPALRVPEPPPDRDGAPAPDAQRGHRDRAPAEAPRAPPVGPGPAAAPPPGPRGRLLLPDHRRARGPRRGAGGRGLPDARRDGLLERIFAARKEVGGAAPEPRPAPRGAVEPRERRALRGRGTAAPSSGTFTITCSGSWTSSRRTATCWAVCWRATCPRPRIA